MPYFVLLPVGYLSSTDRLSFYNMNCIMGYLQVAVVVFLAGVFIHYILNLTQRILMSLFVLQTISSWFS